MKRFINRLAKFTIVGMMFTAYLAPGCNIGLDQATIQSFLDVLGANSDLKFELGFESGNDGFHPNHPDHPDGPPHDHDGVHDNGDHDFPDGGGHDDVNNDVFDGVDQQ